MIEHIAQILALVGAILAVLGAWWRIDTVRTRLEDKIDKIRAEQDMARHNVIDKRIMPKFAEIENDVSKNTERIDWHAERIARLERNGGNSGH